MSIQNLDKLAVLIQREREVLLAHWRDQVRLLPSASHLDIPTLNDHVPALLDELVTAFRCVADETIAEALLDGSPPIHGLQRYDDGFDIVEVVAEYNILRGCINDLTEEHGLSLHGKAFNILNRMLDESIGLAVQTFATHQALEVQRRREEYLALVAHDLRTPLSAISLAARVLEISVPGQDCNSELSNMLKVLRRNARHLEALVDKILKESAHVQTEIGVKLERRVFDLWPFVEAMIHDLNPIAGTGSTQLTNEIPVDLTVYADASLLRRIFQNLVANAINYTPRGEIIIAARKIDSEGGIECRVSDNGSGISVERLAVIFDKLETDPDREGGLGLGLSIVKMFVEAHGGEVDVESKEGIGSTFRFTLPGRMAHSDA